MITRNGVPPRPSRVELNARVCTRLATVLVAGAGLLVAAPTVAAATAAAPSVLGVAPPAGPLKGGNVVVIRVSDAASVTSVDFGAIPSPHVAQAGGDRLTAVAPQHAAGDVDIVVHAGTLNSPTGPADVYRYVPDPPMLHLAKTTLGHQRGRLTSLTCGSRGFCLALEYVLLPRTYTYNLVTFGTATRPASTRADRFLDAKLIACAGPDLCVAGNWSHATVWDGHSWSMPRQLTHGTSEPNVRAVTCAPGTRLCVYIGASHAVVHTRSGWRNSAYPRGFDHPTSVSCPTATRCLAVRKGATAVFDGHRWRASGKALRLDFKARISCPSTHYCVAMGVARTRTASWNRTASWHDGRWHEQPAAPPHCAAAWDCDHGTLACVAPHTCMFAQHKWVATLADGAWSATHVPPGRPINGFACSPGGLCRATDDRGEAVRFVAGKWTSADDVVEYQAYLVDVSCATADWCMAVDASGQAYLYTDGTWTRQGHVDGRQGLAISCTPDRDCVAVDAATGTKPSGLYAGGQALRYVDGHWQPPVQIDSRHALTDISCATSSTCVAVDNYGRAITLHDGTWSAPQQVVDVAAEPHTSLVDVSCPTEDYCVAAGRYTYELRDGSWHRITDLPLVMAVDCPDAGYCVFVDTSGIRVRTGGLLATVLHNKSEDWGAEVTCADRDFCVVNGPFTYQDGGEYQALYAVAGGALRRIGYDELLDEWGMSCIEQSCAAVLGFDAYAGPVS